MPKKKDFDFDHEGVCFQVRPVSRCWSSMWGRYDHHFPSATVHFWIHKEDAYSRFYDDLGGAPSTVRVFLCTCTKCPHPQPSWDTAVDDAKSHQSITRYLEGRQRRIKHNIEAGLDRAHMAAEVKALAICERIADEGYTEEIAYQIKELIIAL